MHPRDCDGGLASGITVFCDECGAQLPADVKDHECQHGSASGVNLAAITGMKPDDQAGSEGASGVNQDERWTTTDTETDNAVMIARDLDVIRDRIKALSGLDYRQESKRVTALAHMASVVWELETM